MKDNPAQVSFHLTAKFISLSLLIHLITFSVRSKELYIGL